MKKQLFNSQELGVLSLAFMKELFPRPRKQQLFTDCSKNDGSCYLFFEETYHEKLYSEIQKHHQNGEFARSNAENDWINIMYKIRDAKFTNENIEGFKEYWLTMD